MTILGAGFTNMMSSYFVLTTLADRT